MTITFVARGIPVIVGEFGLLGFDKAVETIQHGEILKYFEYLSYYAKQKKLTTILWDNGQHYDRIAFRWKNDDFYQVMHEGLTVRSSNAESDSIYIDQDSPIQNASLRINLNGNSLKEIRSGDRLLKAGIDYTLSGDQLTFKSAFLQSLAAEQAGEAAVLTCIFSAGANWEIHLIRYKRPTLRSIEGSRSLFVIPAQFNGDRLAAMEAVYAAGGNAGPDNWTPFKEYGKSFEPDESANLVSLPSEFFDQVEDGEELLKFHFRSGSVIDYKLKVEGSAVIGTSGSTEETAGSDPGAEEAANEPAVPATVEAPADAQSELAADTSDGSRISLYMTAAICAIVVLLAALAIVRVRRRGR